MKKFILTLLAIFELLFYTVFMVLLDSIPITYKILDLFVHFISLIVVAFVFYFLIRLLFQKLSILKDIYLVVVINLLVSLILPVILMIIIPSEIVSTFLFLILVSAFYYGILINILICLFNYFLTKKLG